MGLDAGIDVDAFSGGVELGVEDSNDGDGGQDESGDPDQRRGHFASLLSGEAAAGVPERNPRPDCCCRDLVVDGVHFLPLVGLK